MKTLLTITALILSFTLVSCDSTTHNIMYHDGKIETIDFESLQLNKVYSIGDSIIIQKSSSESSHGVYTSVYGKYINGLPEDTHYSWTSNIDSSYNYMSSTYHVVVILN